MTSGPGIFAGEYLVSNKDGWAYLLIINSTAEDVNLTFPPLHLEEFFKTLVHVRNIRAFGEEEAEDIRNKRITTVLFHLDLRSLN